MFYLYRFCKIASTLGLISCVLQLFIDLEILKWLSLLVLLVLIQIALSFSELKCSIRQIIGMFKIKKAFKGNVPSVENFKGKITYSLPFAGQWTVINGCYTEDFSHSWGIPTQRYAYDFIMLDSTGKSYEGNYQQCENYYCYAQDILAPADGIIIEVVNNAHDSLTYKHGKCFSIAKHICGNYIVIKHSTQEYTTLAHLKKDSIIVKVGDCVLRGQKLATCGNTGNSTEPHLHFQLQTTPSFYDSVGLPIHFGDTTISSIENYENTDPRPHMPREAILEGYITRGFNVSNQ